ncbi:MAG: hypothetical protein P8X57_11880 [Cyclobacteriaceae bacterium]
MKKPVSTGGIIGIAVLIEAVLILLQFIVLRMSTESGQTPAFDSDYIQSRGFFIFQIIGFFAYAIAAFYLCRRHAGNVFQKLLILVIAGGIIEVGFYIISQAHYEGAYLYSVTDKLIGSVIGWIVGKYSENSKELKMPQ